MRHKWCVHAHHNGKVYAQTNLKREGKWVRVLLHRFVMDAVAPVLIDHKDNDGLNCTRDNLRPASREQNQYNSGPRRGRFKGVSWHKKAGKWLAQIMSNRVNHYLGLFDDEENAARAYDRKARELHGEFARTNF